MTEKLYLKNPYLRQIHGRITDKQYMKNKYYIKTNKTIFYPNLADGQPGDKGTINGIKVLDTYEEENDIVHVINENIHSDKVHLAIDWNNRFDYMQQHTGQHLLSSVFYKLYGGETIGFYIGEDSVYIDVDIANISKSEIEKIEQFANKIIFSNFTIRTYKKEGNTRIVEIDGIDFSPCNGTHLRNTGELGIIKIIKVKKHKGYNRIKFVCGNRALKDYTKKNKTIKDIADLLSINEDYIYEAVEELYNKNK